MDLALGRGKGCWYPALASGKKTATLYCPGCGRGNSLVNHSIDAVGAVSPSVVCFYSKDCQFHAVIRLVGWREAFT